MSRPPGTDASSLRRSLSAVSPDGGVSEWACWGEVSGRPACAEGVDVWRQRVQRGRGELRRVAVQARGVFECVGDEEWRSRRGVSDRLAATGATGVRETVLRVGGESGVGELGRASGLMGRNPHYAGSSALFGESAVREGYVCRW